ncbi:putative heparinase superfamily protein [Hephaestia caeni]|uniref:Putative heparinase superfamily protein n=1 Tax=Hephaestia caeni TaxID=645617 RepID=A0A397P7B3_9SPHN|nr:heparinase II/III family protein [Hephaestia caeni]RIA43939.1 putative heparinase superfamily protein [Hephaestia caeni]
MSGHEDDPAADGIEEGKRLIRLGGEKGLSLAERLQDRFHRLTWRTPIHTLRLRGRYPLKLIAVPEDPFFGDVARGNALLEGKLRFRGEERAIDTFDIARPDVSADFLDYVHRFAWLRDLSSVAPRAQAAPIAENLMRRWLHAHADTIADPAWRPDLCGRRLQFWAAHAPLILSSTDLIYRSRVLNTLARGARHIDRVADKQPIGVRRVATWAGVLTAGLLIPGGDARRAVGEAGIAKALALSVFDDGGIVSRSPRDQVALIRILTMLARTYDARRMVVPASIDAALARMVPALLGITHGDHALSSWQGGGPLTADELDRLVDGTGIRTRPMRQAREWGYQRLAAAKAVVIVDAAPPPVARVIDGGCASTLAFEMSDGPHRLIVNCGGARAAVAHLPPDLAEGLRTTAAHSTLVLADSNSTAVLADGTLGKGVAEVELTRQESEQASRIEASHDGYAKRHGFVHRRQLVLTGDGRELRGEDMLLPAGRRAPKRPQTPFAIRFHLGATVQVTQTADGLAALLRLPGGTAWQFRCKGGALGIESSVWIDGDGRPVATQQLVVSGEAAPGGANVSWALKRAA